MEDRPISPEGVSTTEQTQQEDYQRVAALYTIEQHIAELNQRVVAAERERDALAARIHLLEQQGINTDTVPDQIVSSVIRLQKRQFWVGLIVIVTTLFLIPPLVFYLFNLTSAVSRGVEFGSDPSAASTVAIEDMEPRVNTQVVSTTALSESGILSATPELLPSSQPLTQTANPTGHLPTVQQGAASAETAQTNPVSTLPASSDLRTALPTFVSSTPSGTTSGATIILQRLAAAEANLRSGQIEATIDFGGGSRSTAQVHFDMGNDQQPPRFHIESTYTGTAGSQTVARTTIGARSWERQQDGRWIARQEQESTLDQVRVFLPWSESISNARIVSESQETLMHWHDLAKNADLTLLVDPATGIPREFHQTMIATGQKLSVIYIGWNDPVDITLPVVK